MENVYLPVFIVWKRILLLNCLTCNYDQTLKQIQCLSSQENHSLVNGGCIKCGNFCKNWQIYDDLYINQSYLKCFKCIDDSKYYISFDAVNCNENKIDSCFYAFEVIIDDPTQNTIDTYFIPRCGFGVIFVIEISKCLLSYDEICYFSYSEATCVIEITVEMWDEMNENYHVTLSDGTLIAVPFEDDYECLTVNYCIITNDYKLSDVWKITQYSLTCPSYNKNCATCLKDRNLLVDFCLECDTSYYSERLTGKCYRCPPELNCYQCQQQQILLEDS